MISQSGASKYAARLIIMAQIGELRALIDKARSVKLQLYNSHMKITNLSVKWTNKLSAFQSGTMGEIEVIDKFEGVAASEIKDRMVEPVEKMNTSKAAAVTVQGEITTQIAMLDEYITAKQNMITTLMAQL